jgi:prepilin-type N-terminal cleavage/methylation domain-containing protein/prepilin-type processing-associated H-X9-DG protein
MRRTSVLPSPTAFTLVELLTVTAIISILASLLLPAVQNAREASRRASCTNNMRQIGVALHSYHHAMKHLPMGWHATDDAGLPYALGEPGWGWASQILPYVDQGNIVKDLMHEDLPLTAPGNADARTFAIAVFRCPSDTGDALFTWVPDEGTGGEQTLARANYVGVYGTTDIHKCGDVPAGQQAVGNGGFFHNSQVRFEDIRDGLSNTFVVGERTSLLGCSTWVGAPAGDKCAPGLILGTAGDPPNGNGTDIHNFSSNHPTGANFLMGDGAVRMISQAIDESVYHALSTRAGQEIVGPPSEW